MKTSFTQFLLLISALATATYAFPDHSGQCSDDPVGMSQGMGGQNDASIAWKLTSDTKTYTPGKAMKITLNPKSNGAKFTGLLLFARATNNAHLGQWVQISSDYQTLDDQCKQYGLAKSTLSHASGIQKTAPISFTWQPPATGLGDVEFRGIVVTTGKTTWMQMTPLLVNGTGSLSDTAQFPTTNSSSTTPPSKSGSDSLTAMSAVTTCVAGVVGTVWLSWL